MCGQGVGLEAVALEFFRVCHRLSLNGSGARFSDGDQLSLGFTSVLAFLGRPGDLRMSRCEPDTLILKNQLKNNSSLKGDCYPAEFRSRA